MSLQTICGVSLDAFANKPEPEELACIVAAMEPNQQAEFIIALSYLFRGESVAHTPDYQRRLAAICEAIVEDEIANLHGFGSDLIRDLKTEMETAE